MSAANRDQAIADFFKSAANLLGTVEKIVLAEYGDALKEKEAQAEDIPEAEVVQEQSRPAKLRRRRR